MRCANCGSELQPVFDGQKYPRQCDNALEIEFSGGYGMFIDPIGESRKIALLCHDCAHALCNQYPWMAELVDPYHGHMHGSFTEHGHD